MGGGLCRFCPSGVIRHVCMYVRVLCFNPKDYGRFLSARTPRAAYVRAFPGESNSGRVCKYVRESTRIISV